VTTPTARRIPLLDLKAQFLPIREEILAAVAAVFDSQQFILGPDVARLEEEVAEYCGSSFAIGCGSGTDALYLALRALDVGPGDEVLTVPFTFFATAGAIANAGARPVFADIEPGSFNMDPHKACEALKANPRIKAVMPVHLYGACADMDPILAAANRGGIPVIEDAAQAIGSEYAGRRAGSMGLAGCFSFFPSKNLGGAGEGGMITTSDAALAERLRALRVHGSRVRYYHDEVGTNSRLDSVQAAVLRVKLRHLDAWTAGRQSNARLYRELLGVLGLPITLPVIPEKATRHVFNQFVIRAARRDELRQHLAARGIGSEVYYPLPLHAQKCFAGLGYQEGSFPVSEAAAKEVLALPVQAELTRGDLGFVCDAIREFYRS
jgi:dTDP-4-amino-4,6-dideoxygalactose transaminase